MGERVYTIEMRSQLTYFELSVIEDIKEWTVVNYKRLDFDYKNYLECRDAYWKDVLN